MSARTSSTSFRAALGSLSETVKSHHNSVQAAYETYYGQGAASSRPTPDASRSASASSIPKQPAASPSTWQKVKKAAKEHHEAVNSAYELYYGGKSGHY